MIFSSTNNPVVLFLDPQQQQPGSEIDNNQFSLPAPLPPPIISGGGGGGGGGGTTITTGAGSTRPSSMVERARQAKVPLPEAALKCPRCESTNTKFCYFNNYSLTQPRHLCKTCRRYWTRGGSLRNVPVGGGCRRNKRSKKSCSSTTRSKSPLPLERSACSLSTTHDHSTIGHFLPPQAQLPLFPSLPHLSDYRSSDLGPGLNFSRIHHPLMAANGSDGNIGMNMEFQIGSNSWGGSEQWRLQQIQNYPFLVGSERPSGMYQLEAGETVNTEGNAIGDPGSKSLLHSGVVDQMDDSVKMEEKQMSRNFLGMMGNNGHYWGGGNSTAGSAWTNDVSAAAGFGNSASSTSHHLLSITNEVFLPQDLVKKT